MFTALEEVVLDLVHTGTTWAGELPPGIDASTRRRVQGTAFSVLVTLDGDGGPGPIGLAPADQPDVELGGHALHELFGADPADCDNDAQRALLGRVRQLVDEHATRPGPITTTIGGFLADVCRLLAAGYRLQLIETDEDTGQPVGTSGDLAPQLPDAFTTAWRRTGATGW